MAIAASEFRTSSAELPVGWENALLGEVLPLRYGKGLTGEQRDNSGSVPVYGSNGIVGRHSVALTTGPTLVIGRKGSIGEVHYSPLPCWPIDTTFYVEHDRCLELRYFEYLLRFLKLGQHDKSTAVPSLRREEYDAVEVSIPPLSEQHRIVAALDAALARVNAARQRLGRVPDILKRYRAAVLSTAVEGRLTEDWRAAHPEVEPADVLLRRILDERRRKWEKAEREKYARSGKQPPFGWREKYREPVAPDTSELPELPEGWCWAGSDMLFTFVTSGSRGWAEYYAESGPVFLRIGNLDHNSISLDMRRVQRVRPPEGAEGTRTRVRPGDILISITAEVGMVGLVSDDLEEAYINQHIALARPVDALYKPYLAWFLTAKDGGQKQFAELQRGATKVGLGLDDIRSVAVPLPPLAEQREIALSIQRLLALTDAAEARTARATDQVEQISQALLTKAFRGELVPQDPADEPAAVLLERVRVERELDSMKINRRVQRKMRA